MTRAWPNRTAEEAKALVDRFLAYGDCLEVRVGTFNIIDGKACWVYMKHVTNHSVKYMLDWESNHQDEVKSWQFWTPITQQWKEHRVTNVPTKKQFMTTFALWQLWDHYQSDDYTDIKVYRQIQECCRCNNWDIGACFKMFAQEVDKYYGKDSTQNV